MQAILHQDWSVAPEGHTTFHFKSGEVLTGAIAQRALDEGVGFTPVEEIKIEPPVETKRGRRK
jgi:hypothetical protein